MQIYEDIPRLYTALAEWSACLTYLLLIRKTVRSAPFWLISVAFLILQSLWLLSTGNLPTVFWIPSMAVAAVLMYAFLMYGSGLSPLAVGYCCAKAFLLAELAASLEWQLHSYLEAAGLLFASLRLLLLIAVYGICFSTAAFLEKPLFTEEYFRQLTAREMFSAAGITLVVFAFSNLSFIIANSPFTSRLRADIFNIRTLADLAAHIKASEESIEQVRRGDIFVVRPGENIPVDGIVLEGSLQVVEEDIWGNRGILEQVGEGELYGAAFACAGIQKSPVSVVAAKKSRVLRIQMEKLMQVCPNGCPAHQQMIRNLVYLLARKNVALNEKIKHISRRTTREKLLAYLADQAKKAGKKDFSIPFDRQELADYLCVDRSAMSAELGKLKREGKIDLWKNEFRLLS